MALEKDEDGNYKFKVLTVPYGVVPQQDNVHYEEVEESDGTRKTYLVADVILWTGRYPDLLNAKYSKDLYFAQSMEITPSKTSKEDGFLNVEEYQYSALCLLGKSDDASKNIEPCFEQARVEPYKKNIVQMRKKLKTFRRWVDEGRMTTADVRTSVQSWKGHQLKFNSYWARQSVWKLFMRLFYRSEHDLLKAGFQPA